MQGVPKKYTLRKSADMWMFNNVEEDYWYTYTVQALLVCEHYSYLLSIFRHLRWLANKIKNDLHRKKEHEKHNFNLEGKNTEQVERTVKVSGNLMGTTKVGLRAIV